METYRGGSTNKGLRRLLRKYAEGGPFPEPSLRDEDTYGPDTMQERTDRAQATSDVVNAALAKSNAAMAARPMEPDLMGYQTGQAPEGYYYDDAGFMRNAKGEEVTPERRPSVIPFDKSGDFTNSKLLDLAGNLSGGILAPVRGAQGAFLLGSGPVRKAVEVAAQQVPRELSPLGFYSHGAETAANLAQAKGAPDQMTAMLRKYGVKPDELYNAGIADETATNVMRSKIEREYAPKLAAAKLEMDALGLNENTTNKKSPDYNKALEIRQSPETKAKYQYDSALNAMRSDMDSAMVLQPEWSSRPSVTRDELTQHFNERRPQIEERVIAGDDPDSAFSRYGGTKITLPGGENYREVLLKMADESGALRKETAEAKSLRTQAVADYANAAPGSPWAVEAQDRIKKYTKIHTDLINKSTSLPPEFRSSHWDDPNVLAHLRFTDRVGPNGEKILHIEEIQSDWGQKGRKEGFDTPEIRAKMLKQLPEGYVVENAPSQGTGFPDRYFVRNEQGQLVGTGYTRESAINSTINELNDQVRGTTASLVPTAPYVTNTAAWTDLALKRALKEAAEGGYDKLVWTPGAEQARRYDLSRHVDRIAYDPELKELSYVQKGVNGWQTHPENLEPNGLAAVIGKEAADKLLAQKVAPLSGNHVLEAPDMVFGGEGMKAYYDKIVPTQLSKLLKKLDPEARIGRDAIGSGKYEVVLSNGKVIAEYPEKVSADIIARKQPGATVRQNGLEVPSLTITPKMREAIMKGQTDFARGGPVQGYATGGPTDNSLEALYRKYAAPTMRQRTRARYAEGGPVSSAAIYDPAEIDALAASIIEGNYA